MTAYFTICHNNDSPNEMILSHEPVFATGIIANSKKHTADRKWNLKCEMKTAQEGEL